MAFCTQFADQNYLSIGTVPLLAACSEIRPGESYCIILDDLDAVTHHREKRWQRVRLTGRRCRWPGPPWGCALRMPRAEEAS